MDNPEVVAEIFATGYVGHSPSCPELSGIENLKKSVSDCTPPFTTLIRT